MLSLQRSGWTRHRFPRSKRHPLLIVALLSSLLAISLVPESGSALVHGMGVPGRVRLHALEKVAGYAHTPLLFEPNQGQGNREAAFVAHSMGYSVALTRQALTITTAPSIASDVRPQSLPPNVRQSPASQALRLELIGANPQVHLRGFARAQTRVNYFLGRSRFQWRRNVPTYRGVHYSNAYPGIDLLVGGAGGQVGYSWFVHPGSNPARIKLRLTGGPEAQQAKPSLDGKGNLVFARGQWSIRQAQPLVYQAIGGKRCPVAAHFKVSGNDVSFALGSHDPGQTLVIDPTISYSTYLGGRGDEAAGGIAVDASGSAYVAGYTASTDFPVKGASQKTSGGALDAFVAKLSPDGSSLVYATYFGGSGVDVARGIAVDGQGDAYIAGYTNSPDLPTVHPLQNALKASSCGTAPACDVFVAKLRPDGSSLLYSTYLGGDGGDAANGVAVDAQGNAYVTGQTQSQNFPTLGGVQTSPGGGSCNYAFGQLPCYDSFVAKLNPSGSALVYGTYLGGGGDDIGTGIGVDASGAAFLTGYTNSSNFPHVNALGPSPSGSVKCSYALYTAPVSCYDAFVTKVDPSGASLVYSTNLGGAGSEFGWGIALASDGTAYVVGQTNSSDFPTENPLQAHPKGGACGSSTSPSACSSAFVAAIASDGKHFQYSTYLGGTGDTVGRGIASDGAGGVYVTGSTTASDFPTYRAEQPKLAGGARDCFISHLSETGKSFVYSSYLGGTGDDEALAVAVDSGGDAYLTGRTNSADFPSTTPRQGTAGAYDVFVSKLRDTYVEPTATPITTPLIVGSPTVSTAGTSTATPLPTTAPTPVPGFELSVISARIERVGSSPDRAFSRPSLKHAIARTVVRLSIYYAATSAKPTDRVTDEWLVKKNKRIVFRRTQTHRLGLPVKGLYWDHTQFRLGKFGTYIYTGRIRLKGQTDAGRTSLIARKRKR